MTPDPRAPARDTILVAIDIAAHAPPLVTAAQAFARLLDADIHLIHVAETGLKHETDELIAAYADSDIDIVTGDAIEMLSEAIARPDVVAVVVGARRYCDDPRPAGHVAEALAERSCKPLLVVPPESTVPLRIRRVLVPLEGTRPSSAAVAESLERLSEAGVEIVVVHVFEPESVPSFWGDAAHTLDSYAAAFASRWCPSRESVVHLRRGRPQDVVVDMAQPDDVDLVALGWSRHLDPGHARVIRAVLTHCRLPVLLTPVPAELEGSATEG